MRKKHGILKRFDSAKLEGMLRDSTKSTALELVLTLIPTSSQCGILIDLEESFSLKVDPESPSYGRTKTG